MPKRLTKKGLKSTLLEALEPLAKSIQKDFGGVNKRLDKVDGRLDKMDGRFDKVDGRLDKMDGRLDKVDGRLDGLEFNVRIVKSDLAEVKRDVKEMKENSSELFTKLDRFIALYERQAQELKLLSVHVSRLEERVAKLEAERRPVSGALR